MGSSNEIGCADGEEEGECGKCQREGHERVVSSTKRRRDEGDEKEREKGE